MIPIQEMTVSLARVDLVGSSLLSPTQDPGPAEATFLDSSGPGSHPCTWTTHPRCPRPSPVRTSRYSPARVLFPPSVAFFHCCSAELPTLNPSCHLLPGALLVPIPAPSHLCSVPVLSPRSGGWTGRPSRLLCYPSSAHRATRAKGRAPNPLGCVHSPFCVHRDISMTRS